MKRLSLDKAIIILVGVALGLLAMAIIIPKTKVSVGAYHILNNGWTMQINDTVYEDVDFDTFSFPTVNKGDVITIKGRFPYVIIRDPSLLIYTIHSDLVVTVGNNVLYEYGTDRYDQNKLLGYGRFAIPIDNYLGKPIEIKMRVSEDNAFTEFSSPIIYEAGSFYIDYTNANRIPLATSIFLVMFGVMLGVVTLILSFKNKRMLKLFASSMLAIGSGVWSFCSYDLLFLFTKDPLVKPLFEFGALYFSPIFIMLYFSDRVKQINNKVLTYFQNGLATLQISLMAIAFLGQATNLIHFPALLLYQQLLMFVLAAFIVVVMIISLKHKQLSSPILLIGVCAMVASVVFDLTRFMFDKYNSDGFVISNGGYNCIGTLVLVVALIADFCYDVTNALYEEAQNDTLKMMAYTDHLTGLHNRRRCEEIFDEIDSASLQNYIIIEFDLNNLKTVNDTFGHNVGDEYLSAFGDALSKAFFTHGIVGRLGGDEFVAIIKNADDLVIDELLDRLEDEIERINKEHPDWHMSTAYGACTSCIDNPNSARRAFKLADERMYVNKQEMKKNNVAGVR